jgi:hypothetical protein
MTFRKQLYDLEKEWIELVEQHPDDCNPETLAIAAYLKARWAAWGVPQA